MPVLGFNYGKILDFRRCVSDIAAGVDFDTLQEEPVSFRFLPNGTIESKCLYRLRDVLVVNLSFSIGVPLSVIQQLVDDGIFTPSDFKGLLPAAESLGTSEPGGDSRSGEDTEGVLEEMEKSVPAYVLELRGRVSPRTYVKTVKDAARESSKKFL